MKPVHSFAEKYAAVILVVAALFLTGTVMTVEQSLPLQGAATPMYGAMPAPGVRKPVVKKVSQTSSRRTQRALLRPAAGASSSTSSVAWTGHECDTSYAIPTTECAAKIRAVLKGDLSCFKDGECYGLLKYCPFSGECGELNRAVRVVNSLLPECLKSGSAECLAATKLMIMSAPAEVNTCMNDALCAELLGNFRRGEFNCRRYDPCLSALEAITQTPDCDAWLWCKNIKKIDTLYTTGAKKCSILDSADCMKKLGITDYVSPARRIACRQDTDCNKQVILIAEDLKSGNRPECFLWKECKEEFEAVMKDRCSQDKTGASCRKSEAVWNFLTVTNKACVTTGDTPTCKAALQTIVKTK